MTLSRREKWAVAAAVIGITTFLVMQFGVFPLMDRNRQLKRVVAAKTAVIADMQRLQSEYEDLRRRAEDTRRRIAGKGAGGTLFSILDKDAGRIGVKDRIAYMKPSTIEDKDSPYHITTVELKLQQITLAQLVAFLSSVEQDDETIGVRRMSLSRTGERERTIDAVLEFQTVGN